MAKSGDLFGVSRALRTYVDTSVFGGCLDSEFEAPSRRFFVEVGQGRFVVLVSELTVEELSAAPTEVREVFEALDASSLEQVPLDEEVRALMKAYIKGGVLAQRFEADAMHVAAASVAGADLVVSWNFRHVVHHERIRGFHGVNLMRGYSCVDIRAPWEVIHEEEV